MFCSLAWTRNICVLLISRRILQSTETPNQRTQGVFLNPAMLRVSYQECLYNNLMYYHTIKLIPPVVPSFMPISFSRFSLVASKSQVAWDSSKIRKPLAMTLLRCVCHNTVRFKNLNLKHRIHRYVFCCCLVACCAICHAKYCVYLVHILPQGILSNKLLLTYFTKLLSL